MHDKRIITPGVVIDNKDPLMIGRIRVLPLVENELQAYPENWTKEKEWGILDPFVFLPLIPYYISQIPEIDEYVHIMYATKEETKDATKFYIQGPISRPWNNSFETYNNAESVLANGDSLQKAPSIRDKKTGEVLANYIGLYPEPGDNAFIGRGSTDIILKNDDLLLRSGKFNSTNNALVPTKNENRSFVQLSNYDFSLVDDGIDEVTVVEYDDLFIKTYIEWSIENIVTTISGVSIDGYVRLNTIKQDVSTQASNFEVLNPSGSTQYATPISESQLNFINKNVNEVVKLINQYIKGVNQGSIDIITANFSYPSIPGVIVDQFPLVFGPNPKTNELRNDNDPDRFSIFSEIYDKVKFNEVDNTSGFGILWSKNVVGPQTSEKTQEIKKTKYEQKQTTYGVVGGDYLYLLSHQSQKPNFDKINLKDTLYGITQEQFVQEIKPKTSSIVRGEELLDLLNKIVDFLGNHVHPFPGIHPIQEPNNGVKISEIRTLIENAQNTILNQNIRIN